MNKALWIATSAVTGVAALVSAGPARAADVSWSIGIGAPGIGAVVSNGAGYGPVYGPRYRAEPIYVPAPVYLPAPGYVAPPRVIYRRPPVFYRPLPVVDYVPVYRHHGRPVPLVGYPVPYRGWAPPMRHHHDGY